MIDYDATGEKASLIIYCAGIIHSLNPFLIEFDSLLRILGEVL